MSYELSGFDGKVAVVTGAGRMRSIGRTVAVRLAEAGCDVVITGTGRPAASYPEDEKAAGWRDIESVADEIRKLGRRALPVVSNVAEESAVAALAEQVISAFGRVDILVNNAGAARGEDRCAVIDLDPAIWQKVIDVNLTGTFLMSRTFGRHMVEAGRGGSVINISSIAGKRLSPFVGAYAASKAAIHALTACMAQEVGAAQVRVNAICPGVIDTSRMDGIGRGEAWDRTIGAIPLKRAGTGEDIADTVLYLCADQSSWVTGQAWNVDGGSVVQH
jgi:3-oxoacyl-[acyl-carrier protein] reductase